ncbi:hypothetical protein ACFQU7_10595 [Pseudoroseomonas wenyumeiae]
MLGYILRRILLLVPVLLGLSLLVFAIARLLPGTRWHWRRGRMRRRRMWPRWRANSGWISPCPCNTGTT